MNNAISQLHTCLENEAQLVREFMELLESEAQILADGGNEAQLASSTATKERYAEQLATAADTRQALLAALGYGANRAGLDAAGQDHPILQAAIDQLLDYTGKASELNTSNGTLIETFLVYNQQALDMLGSLTRAEPLYDAKGRARPGGKGLSKNIKAG